MFWIETLNKLDKNLKKMFEKIGGDIGTLQSKQEIFEQKLIQLEKRINTISDFIQGPYTKQINQNFAEIQAQIDMLNPIRNGKELAKHFPQMKNKRK